jgi:hypothetical protein
MWIGLGKVMVRRVVIGSTGLCIMLLAQNGSWRGHFEFNQDEEGCNLQVPESKLVM